MEVALIVQLLLSKYQIALASAAAEGEGKTTGSKEDAGVPREGAAAAAAGDGGVSAESDAESPFAWMLVLAQLVIGQEESTWGLGLFGSSSTPPQPPAAGADMDRVAGPLSTWKESGDVHGLLPRCNLQRLVGLKVPAEPCWVCVNQSAPP